MKNFYNSRWFPALCVALILSLVFGGVLLYRADQLVAQGVTNFSSITLSDNLVVGGTSTLTGAVTQSGATTVTGAFTGSSTGDFANDLTLQESLVISQTTISLPNGNTNLVVDVSFYTIDASTAASITLQTTNAVPGQIVGFYGQDNQTITFNDTNIKTSTGNAITLGQYDVVWWVFTGTYWIELLLLANS